MEIQKLKNEEEQNIKEPQQEEGIKEETKENAFTQKDLSDFCSEVLERIKDENIVATPLNFQICFEKLLEEKENLTKETIRELLDVEFNASYDKFIDIERYMRKSFKNMKRILEVVAILYKNQILLHEILGKRLEELKQVDNSVIAQNIIQALSSEISRLLDMTKKQSIILKELYQENANVINRASSDTIFDSQFGIYNNQFIADQLQKEIKSLEKTQRNSTLLTTTLAQGVAKQIKSPQTLFLLQKSIADIFLETSRRSDIVAHYNNGVFMILLRHSDAKNSESVCKRLFELVKSNNAFIENKKITLEINIVIAPLKSNHTIDFIFDSSTKMLQSFEESQKSVFKTLEG